MIQEVLYSRDGQYVRKAWLISTENQPSGRLMVFLDGEFYVERMNISTLLAELGKKYGPFTGVFISNLDAEARHYDYTCNQAYAKFVAEDVLAWINDHYPDVQTTNSLIGGLSLSGLQSAYIAYTYPEIFNRILCQSPSFWWEQEWLLKNMNPDKIKNNQFWISVGDQEKDTNVQHPPTNLLQEVDQVTAVEHMVDFMKNHQIAVNYHPYAGGHNVSAWNTELKEALIWLLQ
ncbi:hypothetical protein BKI52_42135 [marine bacterium AO1-C]|nr:hypothetical protein BKI52_42135 [marine bacterium AO1-C]